MVPISKRTLHRKPSKTAVGRPSINVGLKRKLREFFENTDNITVYPNKKRRDRKTCEPLRVLNMTRKKLYVKFCEETGENISLSTFWRNKPRGIKRKSAARMLQCVCDICQNVELILNSIKVSMTRNNYIIPEILQDTNSLPITSAVALATLCQSRLYLPKCLDRQCSDCGLRIIKEALLPWANDVPDDVIRWVTWKIVESTVKGKVTKRLTKVACENTRTELVTILLEKLESYGRHVYMERTQQRSYQASLKSLKSNQCVVVVDFAENYTCLRQGEAQSAYYTRNQVTLHPMVITMQEGGTVQRDSVCIISDDLKHDACAVAKYFETLLAHIGIMYPDIDSIIVWSDGCSSQYKSKLPFYSIANAFNSKFEIVWNYFGSRHGKSSADGETAVVKTFLGSEVTDTNLVLDNAKEVFTHLVNSERYIVNGESRRHFYFVAKSEMDPLRSNIPNVKTLPGTRRIHQIKKGEGVDTVIFRDLSCFCSNFPCLHACNEWKRHSFKGMRLEACIIQLYNSIYSTVFYFLQACSFIIQMSITLCWSRYCNKNSLCTDFTILTITLSHTNCF